MVVASYNKIVWLASYNKMPILLKAPLRSLMFDAKNAAQILPRGHMGHYAVTRKLVPS